MKKLTLTIGIPAHNEEANIKNMIESVLKQKGQSFVLEKILVVLDGCTDNTFKKVKELAKKNKIVEVINDGKRTGKATRLNQIFKLNKSQLIGTFDADIVLERNCEFEVMIKEFIKNKNIKVVAARQFPIPSDTWMGKFSDASFMMLQTASMVWRNGNNIHSLQGSASIIKAGFAKSIKYPRGTICDQGYLYMSAIKKGREGFSFAKKTRIIFRSPNTFSDWRKLGARTIIDDKENLAKNFGEKALAQYRIPKKYIYKALLIIFLKDPLGALGSTLMNLYIRIFPYTFEKKKSGIWEITKSSKASIKI